MLLTNHLCEQCAQLFAGCSSNATQPSGYSTLSPAGPYTWRAGQQIDAITITSPQAPNGSQLQSAPCISPALPSGLSFILNQTIGAYQIHGTPDATSPQTSYTMILVDTSDILSSLTLQGRVLAAVTPSPAASASVTTIQTTATSTQSTLATLATSSASGILPQPSVTPSLVPDSSGSSVPLGAIVGGVIAALVVLFIIGILFFVFGSKNPMISTSARPKKRPPVGKIGEGVELDGYAEPLYAIPQTFPNTQNHAGNVFNTNTPVSVLPVNINNSNLGHGNTTVHSQSSTQSYTPQPEYHTLPVPYAQRQNRYAGQQQSLTNARIAGAAAPILPNNGRMNVAGTQPRMAPPQQQQQQPPHEAGSSVFTPPPPYQAFATPGTLDGGKSTGDLGISNTSNGSATVVAAPGETVMLCALAYVPRRDDELELKIGDTVSIVWVPLSTVPRS